jgi:molecular chaperone GrpE
MSDSQALFDEFVRFVQTAPSPPDFFQDEPESLEPVPDVYSLMAEWSALRHEVKQQGKLLQASHGTLKKALDNLEQQTPPAAPTPTAPATPLPELFKQLLTILDDLDRAEEHLQSQIENPAPSPVQALPGWKQSVLTLLGVKLPDSAEVMTTALASHLTGLTLIRRNLLELLAQHEVVPMNAEGSPFDGKIMYALGREVRPGAPENTVCREVVKGYWQGERVLREAQVIVAAR